MGVIYNGSTYFYRKNAQNDIIALLDKDGNVVVKYTYDAWGNNTVTVLDASATAIANLNPFRYRSYYYDTETNLYFLKTRYYDPEVCRFMTIDGIRYLNSKAINGLNLYAYCGNNPIMAVDPDGNFALLSIGLAALGALALGGIIGGIAAGASGGTAGDVFAGIGKGVLNTAVILGSSMLVAKSFSAPGGVTSVSGSLMLTYGLSVIINMADVFTVQCKKSVSDSDGFWETLNDINNSMFSNIPGILLGKASIDGVTILGTKLFSKLTLVNKFLTIFFSNLALWSFNKAFSITNLSFWSGRNTGGLVLGLLFLIPGFIKLTKDITSEPDFDESTWILN